MGSRFPALSNYSLGSGVGWINKNLVSNLPQPRAKKTKHHTLNTELSLTLCVGPLLAKFTLWTPAAGSIFVHFPIQSLLQTALYCNIMSPATHCNTLQHIATHCNTLHNTATDCSTLQYTAFALYCTANTLYHIAIHCNTLRQDDLELQQDDLMFSVRHTCKDWRT